MSDDDRRPHTTVRLVDPTHARLKEHCREGETLSGAVDRALDALEREDRLPDVVTDLMDDGHVVIPAEDGVEYVPLEEVDTADSDTTPEA